MPAQISWSVGEFVIPGVLLNGSFSEGFPVVPMVLAHVSAAGSGSQSPSAQRGTRLTGERGSVPSAHQPHHSGGNLATDVGDDPGQFEEKE